MKAYRSRIESRCKSASCCASASICALTSAESQSRIWRSQRSSGRRLAEAMRAKSFGLLRSEEHTSELQSPCNLVCRLLLEKKKINNTIWQTLYQTATYYLSPHAIDYID